MMKFFSNQGPFGRLMARFWILFAANLLFMASCLPIVTAGAGLSALYYTTLRTLRGDGELHLVSTFWKGFKDNWKQGTIAWLVLLALAFLLYLEIFWCGQIGGWAVLFQYALLGIGLAALSVGCYLFPVIAAFRGTLPQLVRNSFYFVMKRPPVAIIVVVLYIVPMYWTWLNTAALPLYAFLWCTVGFSGIAILVSKLILPLFVPYLPAVDSFGNILEDGEAPSGRTADRQTDLQTLEDMKKLGM